LVEVEEDVGREVDPDLGVGLLYRQVLDLPAHVEDVEDEVLGLEDEVDHLRVQRRGRDEGDEKEDASHGYLLSGTSSIGWKCGTMIVIFGTLSGGAGKRAQTFTVSTGLRLCTPWLQTHLPSVSRTTKIGRASCRERVWSGGRAV